MRKSVKKKVTKKKAVLRRGRRTVSTVVSREIDRRFDFVNTPTDEHVEACIRIRKKTKQLARDIARNTPVCREQSLAITKLEETLHFAIAAIVRPRHSIGDN